MSKKINFNKMSHLTSKHYKQKCKKTCSNKVLQDL